MARSPLVAFLLLLVLVSTTSAVTREEVLARLEPYVGKTVTRIRFAGNNVTKDWVITREIWTEVGDTITIDGVNADIVRLENLAIFGSVIVEAKDVNGGVELDYQFTEMPWIIPFPALSYTEENGFSVGLGVSSPNFLGRKILLTASVLFGGTTTARFKGENPWIFGNHVSAGIEAYHQVRTNELLEFQQTSDLVDLKAGKYLGEIGRLGFHGGFYGVGSDQDGITLDADNYDELWNAAGFIGMDTRDSWRMPRQGWKNELHLQYYGGSANMLAANFDANMYIPLARSQAIAMGPLLSLQTGDVDEEIPGYLQYFMGGANSIRGYNLEELGKELFGKNQFLYNLEYRWDFLPVRALKVFKWSFGVGLQAAGFCDVGVAWSQPEELSLNRTKIGFGAGLRVLLPAVEMMRLDVGVSQTGDVVFNFGMNTIFFGRKLRVR